MSEVHTETGSARVSSGVTRRGFLQGVGGSTVALGVASQVVQKAYARGPMNLGTRSDINFLMQRATRGFNKTTMDLIERYNVTTSLYRDWLLDVAPTLNDDVMEEWVGGANSLYPFLNASACCFWPVGACPTAGSCPPGAPDAAVAYGPLQGAMLGRSVTTVNKLYDRTVEFFTNHFSIYIYKDLVAPLKLADDRDVIRAHAFGKFPEMLKASAHSPAMLVYLDNIWNGFGGQVNENYGREILELHTIAPTDFSSPGAVHYTENDVKAATDILSGWRITAPGFTEPLTEEYGHFHFDPNMHVSGAKQFLGHTFHNPADPEAEGDDFLDLLVDPVWHGAHNPVAEKTARHLVWKMARWFLGYDPDISTVDGGAAVYMATDGDIKEILRFLLSDANLALYNTLDNLKVKTPYEFIVSLFNATEATMADDDPTTLNKLANMGQMPYAWAPPNGYPDSADAWGRNLFPRIKFAHDFFMSDTLANGIAGVTLTDTKLAEMMSDPANPFADLNAVPNNRIALSIERMLTGVGTLSPDDVSEAQQFAIDIMALGVPKPQAIRETCGLLAGGPSFQLI